MQRDRQAIDRLVLGLSGADQSIQAVQLSKQVTGTGVFLPDYKTSSALHSTFGVQRELARDFVVSADFVYRHFVHLTLGGAVGPACLYLCRENRSAGSLCQWGD